MSLRTRRPERADAGVQIAGVIQDDCLHVRRAVDVVKNDLPVFRLKVRWIGIGSHRKDVEVPDGRRHFIADNGGEVPSHSRRFRKWPLVDVSIVVRGNRQLDAFSRQRNHPLLHRRIAVAGVGQRMRVRITRDIAFCRNLAANLEGDRLAVAGV